MQNFPSAKLLLNNKGLTPIEVRPTLYDLDGNILEVAPVTVEANSHRFINLSDWANLGGESFRRGSIRLFHTGLDLIPGSQIYLENEADSLSFEERFIELGKFDSRRLEGIWYMPRNQTQVTIILSNTSDEMISVTAKLSKNPRQSGEALNILLQPHQTRVLDLRNDFPDGNNFADGRIIGLSLEHSGGTSALKAHGQIKDAPKDYSNIINFTNPTAGKSSELHGTGLHLGAFGSENLEPIVAVKNAGTEQTSVTAKVPYTRTNGTTGMVNLSSFNLKPGEMRLLNMDSVIQRSQQEQIGIAGIEISYNTAPGSVLVSAQSINQSLRLNFRVPMGDPYALSSSTGGYPWRIDETSSTVAYIKNTTETEKEYVAALTWNGGDYLIGLKKIAPHQTVQIDVKKLRDDQTPDERGIVIPANVDYGQVKWTIRSEKYLPDQPLHKFELTGRSEQIDTVKGISSSYACHNCCQKTAWGWIDSGGVYEAEIGDHILFTAWEEGYDCYGWYYPAYEVPPNEVDWDSSDNDIAVVDNGLVTVIGVGEFEIDGEWLRDVTTNYGGWCPDMLTEKSETKTGSEIWDQNFVPDCSWCQTGDIWIGSDVEILAKPKVTNVTAADATKITQINGNQNIIHFVTPKGAQNSQVTLTATITPNNSQATSQINWEGATESSANPLEATVPKSSPGKNVVKIKYGDKTLKELRVWVVWATQSPNIGNIQYYNNAGVGNPQQSGGFILTDVSFSFTINPATIITDTDRPNFGGANVNGPPGGNHPFFNLALTGGANKKWDVSRQIRARILNPNNIAAQDQSQPPFVDVLTYPATAAEGNDDSGVCDPECNNPYAQETICSGTRAQFACTNPAGTLFAQDNPRYGIRHSAGANGDTFETRLQFREFVRLEIEGVWTVISDYTPWKAHIRLIRQNGFWIDDTTVVELNNNGF